MVTLSRNTQGGLGHRLRGRRGESAAPTPAERQWRRRPERNGATRAGGRERRGREETRPCHTAERQHENGEETEQRQHAEKANQAAYGQAKVWEGSAGDASLYGKGRGPVTSQKAAERARGGEGGTLVARETGAEEEGGWRRGQEGIASPGRCGCPRRRFPRSLGGLGRERDRARRPAQPGTAALRGLPRGPPAAWPSARAAAAEDGLGLLSSSHCAVGTFLLEDVAFRSLF